MQAVLYRYLAEVQSLNFFSVLSGHVNVFGDTFLEDESFQEPSSILWVSLELSVARIRFCM